jgi:hypothetical protein
MGSHHVSPGGADAEPCSSRRPQVPVLGFAELEGASPPASGHGRSNSASRTLSIPFESLEVGDSCCSCCPGDWQGRQ